MAANHDDKRHRYIGKQPADFASATPRFDNVTKGNNSFVPAIRNSVPPRDRHRVRTDPNNPANQPVLASEPIVELWDAIPSPESWEL